MKNRTRQMTMLAVCVIWPILANPVIAGEPECKVPGDCDDANDCTVDTCEGGMCIPTPVPDMTGCDDGDACTYDDYCDYGVCYGYAQWCTDGDDCTIDYCDPGSGCVNELIDCDDGNPCTADDCDFQGGCFYAQVQCPAGESCNPNTGECAVPLCPEDLSWNGAVDAADLAILLGTWGPVPTPDPPDFDGDGDVDAADLAQLLGSWGPCPEPKGCQGDEDCPDDGIFCNGPEECLEGSCEHMGINCPAVICGDTCNEEQQSCNSPAGTPCGDGDACTIAVCDGAGGCVIIPVGCGPTDGCCSPGCDAESDPDCPP